MRRYFRAILLATLLTGLAQYAFVTQWRFQTVALKLSGDLPGATWPQILELFKFSRQAHETPQAAFARAEAVIGEPPCPSLWSTPLGQFWGRASDGDILGFLVKEQLIDKIYHNASAAIRAGDTVLDIGGHLGTFTRFALDRGAQRVVVFEPEPVHLACFERTFSEAIAAGRVTLVQAAAWDHPGELRFATGDDNAVAAHVDQDGKLIVEAVTIDHVVAEMRLLRVDFIKMDIEGAERHALAGAKTTLARFRPRMSLSAYHRDDDREVLPRLALASQPLYQVTLTDGFAYFR